jgi:hypothetical protein
MKINKFQKVRISDIEDDLTPVNLVTVDADGLTKKSSALKTSYDSAVTWISTNGTNLIDHLSNIANPHNVTKTQVGLSNVDNTSDVLKPVSTATQTALNLKLDTSLKGSANGLAELDSNGFVVNTQLPSYVDDVLEFANLAGFPATGESGKIYIAIDTNKTYRWSGTTYAVISESLALGETSATAYRGDRGKIAYDHTLLTNNPHSVTPTQLGLVIGTDVLAYRTFGTAANSAVGDFYPAMSFANADRLTKTTLSGIVATGITVDASNNVSGIRTLASNVATGTAPFTVASTTKVTNLNADLLDGLDSTAFQLAITNNITGTGTANYIPKFTASGVLGNSVISEVAGGIDVSGTGRFTGILVLGQYTTATEPAYVKGAQFFNTTLNKMRIGGASAWETVTSS